MMGQPDFLRRAKQIGMIVVVVLLLMLPLLWLPGTDAPPRGPGQTTQPSAGVTPAPGAAMAPPSGVARAPDAAPQAAVAPPRTAVDPSTPRAAADPAPPRAATATAPPRAQATAPAAAPGPRFDVVRVGARGTAVIAGRAAPGAEIILLADGEREIGRTRADARGEWVILPAEPLAPGTRELSLRARLNGTQTAGADTVVVLVPDPSGPAIASIPRGPGTSGAPQVPAPTPLAVLLPPRGSNAPPRVLQGPPEAALPRPGTPPRLGLSSVDYGDGGDMRFAGTAPPGTTVRVYVGERPVGDAEADPTGRWTLTPAQSPPLGRATLRVDQLAAGGVVAARIEQPIENAPPPEGTPRDGRVVVQPGTNLWRIARQSYGQGTRFTVIFAANREQIRDPNRIYPGQVFALPEPQAASATR